MDRVRIGYVDYDIVPNTNKKLDGQFIHTDKQITISENLNPADKLNTIIHEILHGIWFHWGLGEQIEKPKKAEEMVVTALANGLTNVIRDNPQFLSDLSDLAYEEEWHDKDTLVDV